jgi:hypothetical protein
MLDHACDQRAPTARENSHEVTDLIHEQLN